MRIMYSSNKLGFENTAKVKDVTLCNGSLYFTQTEGAVVGRIRTSLIVGAELYEKDCLLLRTESGSAYIIAVENDEKFKESFWFEIDFRKNIVLQSFAKENESHLATLGLAK